MDKLFRSGTGNLIRCGRPESEIQIIGRSQRTVTRHDSTLKIEAFHGSSKNFLWIFRGEVTVGFLEVESRRTKTIKSGEFVLQTTLLFSDSESMAGSFQHLSTPDMLLQSDLRYFFNTPIVWSQICVDHCEPLTSTIVSGWCLIIYCNIRGHGMKRACIAPCCGLTGRRKKVWNLHDNGSSPLKMEVSWGKKNHKWRNMHGHVWLPNGKLSKLCHYTILDVDHNQAKIQIWGTLCRPHMHCM